MTLVDLDKLKSLLSSGDNADEECEIFQKMLFMILAKAARVDLHADATEVTVIQAIMKEYTGAEYTAAEIHTEALNLANEKSLRPVSQLAAKLPESLCVLAINALKQVMQADDKISYAEIDYFNAVAGAMRLSHADVAGLVQD